VRVIAGASAVLEEFVGRNRDADLARLWLHEMRERIEANIDDHTEKRDDDKEPKQARHGAALALVLLVAANGPSTIMFGPAWQAVGRSGALATPGHVRRHKGS
jgi:hypothetical protein